MINSSLLLSAFNQYDAIGNDTAAIAKYLKELGHCSVYSPSGDRCDVPRLTRGEFLRFIQDPENLLIYQHCWDWPMVEDLLMQARCRLVFRYQNITPSKFFDPYNSGMATQSRLGEEQTVRLWRNFPDALWLPNSNFTASTLPQSSKERFVRVLPPFTPPLGKNIKFPKIARSLVNDERESSQNHPIRLLFVGRLAPNKGHAFLIEAIHRYNISYDRRVDLCFVGRLSASLANYRRELDYRIAFRGLSDQIRFDENSDNKALLRHYRLADYFLCASEHEGFCVPLVEAQREELPILAVKESAIADTLGSDQLLLPRDPDYFAAGISILEKEPSYRNWLIERGRRNASRFDPEIFREMLIVHISDWLAMHSEP